MKSDSSDLQPDILDTTEETKFNDLEQKNKDMSLFEDFNYKTPGKMLQTLHNLKRVDSSDQETFSIEKIIEHCGNKV